MSASDWKSRVPGKYNVLLGWPDFLYLLRKCPFLLSLYTFFKKKILEVVEGGLFKNLWSRKLPLMGWEISHPCTLKLIRLYFPKRERILQDRMRKKYFVFLKHVCRQESMGWEICWMYVLGSADWWVLIPLYNQRALELCSALKPLALARTGKQCNKSWRFLGQFCSCDRIQLHTAAHLPCPPQC